MPSIHSVPVSVAQDAIRRGQSGGQRVRDRGHCMRQRMYTQRASREEVARGLFTPGRGYRIGCRRLRGSRNGSDIQLVEPLEIKGKARGAA